MSSQASIVGSGGAEQSRQSATSQYNFSKSNLVLMIGGQVLLLAILLMIVMFGTAPLTFPAQAVRNALSRTANINAK